jgi:hypothetical protein
VERIRQTTEQLLTASQKFAEVLYANAQQQQQGGQPTESGTSGNDDDVVDAEVVDEGGQQSA